jgi:hypothetical protein
VEYCTIIQPQNTDPSPEYNVKFVVLDTPYTSVKQMVVDGSKAIKCFGLSIPETMVRIACRVVRGKVSARLGSDPFDLKPLRLVESVARDSKHLNPSDENSESSALPPCQIFSALHDDYIPVTHGREMQQAWNVGDAGCNLEEFPGRHFGEREPELLLMAVDHIKNALVFDKKKAEEQALASLNINCFMTSSTKIPWAGVW